MRFEGKVVRDGKFWLAEIPLLERMTEGKTRKEALEMAAGDTVPTVDKLDELLKAASPVATAARRTACLHVSRAMRAVRRREDFDFTSRLGRRTEAGPRQVLPCVNPPIQLHLDNNFFDIGVRCRNRVAVLAQTLDV
jgi:hypothetical protein